MGAVKRNRLWRERNARIAGEVSRVQAERAKRGNDARLTMDEMFDVVRRTRHLEIVRAGLLGEEL